MEIYNEDKLLKLAKKELKRNEEYYSNIITC